MFNLIKNNGVFQVVELVEPDIYPGKVIKVKEGKIVAVQYDPLDISTQEWLRTPIKFNKADWALCKEIKKAQYYSPDDLLEAARINLVFMSDDKFISRLHSISKYRELTEVEQETLDHQTALLEKTKQQRKLVHSVPVSGSLLILIGAFLCIYGIKMNTSISYGSGEWIHNIGSIADKQNTIMLGGILLVIGMLASKKKH